MRSGEVLEGGASSVPRRKPGRLRRGPSAMRSPRGVDARGIRDACSGHARAAGCFYHPAIAAPLSGWFLATAIVHIGAD